MTYRIPADTIVDGLRKYTPVVRNFINQATDEAHLSDWNGNFCVDADANSWIEFDTEQDAVLFILRWS